MLHPFCPMGSHDVGETTASGYTPKAAPKDLFSRRDPALCSIMPNFVRKIGNISDLSKAGRLKQTGTIVKSLLSKKYEDIRQFAAEPGQRVFACKQTTPYFLPILRNCLWKKPEMARPGAADIA